MIGRLVVCNLLATQLLTVFIASKGVGYLGEEDWQAKRRGSAWQWAPVVF
jgi:hypothetical protein